MVSVAPVVHLFRGVEVRLPPVRVVEQRFEVAPAIDVTATLQDAWRRLGERGRPTPGSRIAVAVGSRGIDGLCPLVRAVIAELRLRGSDPFIVPAMGSHGGATAEGQVGLLAQLGVTPESVGAPIRATMETVSMGEADGIPLLLDRHAADADGIVLVNRVKPHTDFTGPMGSGLLKLLAIGLGKQEGASHYHRAGVARDLGEVIRVVGTALLERAPIFLGVAVVENQQHRVCDLRLLPAAEIVSGELRLQEFARSMLPGLPLDDIDVLIVDEMGKEISGAGLDPNVTGRSAGQWQVRRDRPRIERIVVRDLTPASEGNACGLAFVDVATARLIEKVDLEVTAANAVTSCFPEDVRLPLTVPTEREALAAALATVRPFTEEDLRIVHIRNTLALERLVVSEGCLPQLQGRNDVVIGTPRLRLDFDSEGALISPLALGTGAAPQVRPTALQV